MKVLIVGSGGREHALAWKISQSPLLSKLYVAPGNAGCAEVAECVDIDAENITALVAWAGQQHIDFVIPGSETALCAGIQDELSKYEIRCFGPTKLAAQLEGSKSFAKFLMRRHGIPTAQFAVFEQYEAAMHYLDSREEGGLVVKADGLAAGKGVLVCQDKQATADALKRVMVDGEFGRAGQRIVLEELITGEEVSVLALTDGKTIAPLEPAQDHKPVYDNDQGPNTGGMGAYSPALVLDQVGMDRVVEKILVPIIHAMNSEGRRFRGLLYAGLMISPAGPRVIEFNVRFGDPETQPLMLRLQSDLLAHLLAVTNGKLADEKIVWSEQPAVCVVMSAPGYPGKYEKNIVLGNLKQAEEIVSSSKELVKVFHAGTDTRTINGVKQVVSTGGRVLGVTARGRDLESTIKLAYKATQRISFPGAHYRTDIGMKALNRE